MTHILIPAYNEQDTIGRAIDSVMAAGVQPIVLPNGCCDETAAVADAHGAMVLEQERAGKMPALQEGLRFLGEQALAEPILILDADSWPVFPRRWVETMSGNVDRQRDAIPRVAVGQLVYRHGVGVASNAVRTGLHFFRQARSIAQCSDGSWPGSNMALRLHTPAELDMLLDIPHYWPGEDLAIRDAILGLGGLAIKSLHPYSAVFTDSRFHRNFFSQLTDTREERMKKSVQNYEGRGAHGSVPYQRLPAYQHLASSETTTA